MTQVPEISITQVEPNQEEISEAEESDLDINDTHTDCENVDSNDELIDKQHEKSRQERGKFNRSPMLGGNIRKVSVPKTINEALTDVEDYNTDDDSDDDEVNNAISDFNDIKLTLDEMLDLGYVEESLNEIGDGRTCGTKKFVRQNTHEQQQETLLKVQKFDFDDTAALTDCENMETSGNESGHEDDDKDDVKQAIQKKYNEILCKSDNKNTIKIQNSVDIDKIMLDVTDQTSTDDDDDDEDSARKVSKLRSRQKARPKKTSTTQCSLNPPTNRKQVDFSDVEDLIFTDDETKPDNADDAADYCGKMKHSYSNFAADEIAMETNSASEDEDDIRKQSKSENFPTIDISFLRDEKTILRQRKLKDVETLKQTVEFGDEQHITEKHEKIESQEHEIETKGDNLETSRVSKKD